MRPSLSPNASHPGGGRTSSLWQAITPDGGAYPQLIGTAKTDVLVIGAGFTGLSAAMTLRQQGVETIILEAQEPGAGASGRNSGLVIPTLSRPDPDDIVRCFGASGERFVALLRDSADDLFEMACSLGLGPQAEQAGWLQPAHTPGRMHLIERRAAQWQRWGARMKVLDREQTREALGSEMWFGGLLSSSGGTVNPLALVRAMAKATSDGGGRVYAHTPAVSLERKADCWQVATPCGEVQAKSLIIATNAYTGTFAKALLGDVTREIVPVTSWLVATEPLARTMRSSVLPTRLAMSDTRGDLYFARYDSDHRLISGGALINPIDRPARLKQMISVRLEKIWPQTRGLKMERVWSGRIGVTQDRFPRFHVIGPNAFAWTGCNGRAVALSVVAGRELAKASIGVPLDEIALPFSAPAPLRGHILIRCLSPLALLHYRRIDAREL